MYAMSNIWERRIEAGDKTLAECAKTKYYGEVLQLLEQDFINGGLAEEQYYEILGLPVPQPEE